MSEAMKKYFTKSFEFNDEKYGFVQVYQFTNFIFDNSVLEVWMALLNGAAIFCPKTELFCGSDFVQDMRKFSVSHALLFPGVVGAFSDEEVQEMRRLRYWVVGAEKATKSLLHKAIEAGVSVGLNKKTQGLRYEYYGVFSNASLFLEE